ncbi:MAG: sensor domain-containing diguanylate cyclase, partial [Wenzhouxiangellaceae bacterium]
VIDRAGGFTLVNQRAATILGYELHQLREMRLRDFVRRCLRVDGAVYPLEQFPAWQTLSSAEPQREQVMSVRRPDGDLVWLEISTEPVREDSEVAAVVATFSDVTERRRFERSLQDSQQRLSLAVEGARLGMWDWRPGSGEFNYNRILAAMIGAAEMEAPRARKAVWSLAHPEDEPRLARAMKRHLNGELSQFDVDVRIRKHDGEYLWTNIRGQVTERAANGDAVRVTGMLIDISERKLLENRLEQLATTDELTGLLNRRAGAAALEHETARSNRGGKPCSLVLLDLDGFKQINDSFGHDAGDLVLAELGGLIRACVRECDTASRWGGEEFALVLPDSDQAGARVLAERLVPRMRELATPDGRGVTASFGIATYRPPESLSELVKRADRLMYQAKRDGRARICVEASTGDSGVAKTQGG